MRKIILIDGHSLPYRAFYALPDNMKTSSGIPTNALYGFTSMLMKIIDENPDFIAICFDLKEPTFRHKEYKEYKAKRQVQPPTLTEQLPYIKEISETLGIPIYTKEGFEADDVIGTLAKEAEKQGLQAEIVSGDKDLFQVASPHIHILRTTKGISEMTLYDPAKIKEETGLTPEKIPDFKALRGDPSDNIPGIPGIGEKTALKLLEEFHSLENLLENTSKIENQKLREKIEQNKDLAILSKRLGTIITNVPIEIDFKKAKREPLNWQKIIPLFEKFEFRSLVKKYSGRDDSNTLFAAQIEDKKEHLHQKKYDYKCILDENELKKLVKEIEKKRLLAFDTETTGLDTFSADLVGISICLEKEKAYYIPVKLKGEKTLSLKKIKDILGPIFADENIKKYGHNLKYDVEILEQAGIKVKGLAFDTLVAAYLIDPNRGTSIALKNLSSGLLNRQTLSLSEVLPDKKATFDEVKIEDATLYACQDADLTFQIKEILEEKLKEKDLLKLFYEVEMPLIEVLIKMEENGTYIDKDKLASLSKKIKKTIAKLRENIFILAGEKFNLDSPKQLQDILFKKLSLPVSKKTKTGYSTDASVLEELAPEYEIARHLLEYRTLSKLISTYIDALPQIINTKTGRIHTSFNQTITATGRLSSSNPNLQNIPAKGELAQEIRSAFVAEKKSWKILSADYSQIELRILAHLSQDENLIRAFKNDEDIHAATAQAVGVERDKAKAINFGIVYGISDFGLAKQLDIKRTEAAEFIALYFNKYPKVKIFMDKTIEFARKNGYVITMLGRKRDMLDINSPNLNQRLFAERTAINTPVQGTAADMIKVAMINIQNELEKKDMRSKMILQVHDELVFEVAPNEAEELSKIVEGQMKKALPLDVPIKIDLTLGGSWGEK